ncbi:aldehyde dehydrogenase [Xylaria bambusicola]|uniref:aldehyde dehydrogenase n=1 Tax=Xylaria bambusicola TaxID=326684 RepID=UPI0020085E60|nr:aldehyde dehydrogenase [Xylaria bambusicola]KAI0515299.1 aldehyde dehydrogenase [Xylaria bambusicola]
MANLNVDLTAPNGKKFTLPTGLFINNEFVKASGGGEKITSINPTNEQDICSVEAASADDVDKAVAAARAALNHESWRDISGTERGALMFKLADLAEQEKEVLATIETWDNGKPYGDALGDLDEVISCLRYYGGWADKIHGQTIPTTPQKFAYTLKQPIGVCGQIIPWNYPLAMAAWKLGPALACGNTIVLKPAEQTPLSILYFATLIAKAGFPAGVVNIINGYGRVAGQALASHLDVDKVAFTGSTATGKHIMKTASINMKNITLETGGKSPLLVFADADLEQAAKWAHVGIMSNQGQICTATSRVLVHENVYDKFVALFREEIKNTSKVGDPFAEGTFQGPQVTKVQYERVLDFVQSGQSEGATLAMGGKPCPLNGKGYFIEPTVFTDVKDTMSIYREEVFGPFVVVASFKTEDEAVRMANSTTYGLGASLFSQNIELAHRVAARIESGMVWINSSNDSDFRVPFGGVKQSGIGRELGEAGLAAYSQTKAVHVNMGTKL